MCAAALWRACGGARAAEDREVVGLGGARGPHQLLRRAHDQRRDLRARLLDARARQPAVMMHRRWIAEHALAASGTRPSPPPPADRPAWSRRSRDRPARGCHAGRAAHGVLAGAAPPLLHGGQDAAQDVDLVGVRLGALQQPADALHQVRAALGAIAKIDLLEHRVRGARTVRSSSLGRRQRRGRVAPRRWRRAWSALAVGRARRIS